MSNRYDNEQTSLCPEIKHGYQIPLQSNLSQFASVLMTFRKWSKLIISNTLFLLFFLKKYFETTFDTHTHTYNSVVITDKHNFSETRQKVQNLKNIKKYGSIS